MVVMLNTATKRENRRNKKSFFKNRFTSDLRYPDMTNVDICCRHDRPDIDLLIRSAKPGDFAFQEIKEFGRSLTRQTVSGEWFDSLNNFHLFLFGRFCRFDQSQKIVADIDADRNVFLYGRLPGESQLDFFWR